jgi:acyl-CoA reductase-like NAD-dependent aldehyde dehydrogenase
MKPHESDSGAEQTSPSTATFEVETAQLHARTAQPSWANTPLHVRLDVVRQFRKLIAREAEAFAQNQTGHRPLAEVLASELLPLAEACRFLEQEAERILASRKVGWRKRPAWLLGTRSNVIRDPHGLVLIISPSNYPILLPGVHVLQALVAGNAVLLKPGEGGGAAANELAQRLYRAGLRRDILHVLPESAQAARDAIATGPDKVVFTGSAEVGTKVLTQLAPHAVPATMELAGCDAVLVRPDADLDLAARALAFGLRLNSGNTCIAPRRVLVSRSIATEFEGRLSQELAHNPPAPLTSRARVELLPLIQDALADGAHLLAGKVEPGVVVSGPIVVCGLQPTSPLLRKDFFAPVMSVLTVEDDESAIRIANDNPFALGASIFSRDLVGAEGLARRIHAGVVCINDLIAPTADARLPFGGHKRSGFGVTRGEEGLLEMTRPKAIIQRATRWHIHLDPPTEPDSAVLLAYLAFTHADSLAAKAQSLIRLLRAVRARTTAQSSRKK